MANPQSGEKMVLRLFINVSKPSMNNVCYAMKDGSNLFGALVANRAPEESYFEWTCMGEVDHFLFKRERVNAQRGYPHAYEL